MFDPEAFKQTLAENPDLQPKFVVSAKPGTFPGINPRKFAQKRTPAEQGEYLAIIWKEICTEFLTWWKSQGGEVLNARIGVCGLYLIGPREAWEKLAEDDRLTSTFGPEANIERKQ